MQIQNLPLESVFPNPDQPRKKFPETHVKELADSIAENGLLQPISVVRSGDGFKIVAGECRYRAHRLLGSETIAAQVLDKSDREVDEAAIIENLQRQDLSILDEARSYKRFVDLYGVSSAEFAKKIGKRVDYVENRLKVLYIKEEFQFLIEKGALTLEMALSLADLDGSKQAKAIGMLNRGEFQSNKAFCDFCGVLACEADQNSLFEVETKEERERNRRKAVDFENRVDTLADRMQLLTPDFDLRGLKSLDPNRSAVISQKLGLLIRQLSLIKRIFDKRQNLEEIPDFAKTLTEFEKVSKSETVSDIDKKSKSVQLFGENGGLDRKTLTDLPKVSISETVSDLDINCESVQFFTTYMVPMKYDKGEDAFNAKMVENLRKIAPRILEISEFATIVPEPADLEYLEAYQEEISRFLVGLETREPGEITELVTHRWATKKAHESEIERLVERAKVLNLRLASLSGTDEVWRSRAERFINSTKQVWEVLRNLYRGNFYEIK